MAKKSWTATVCGKLLRGDDISASERTVIAAVLECDHAPTEAIVLLTQQLEAALKPLKKKPLSDEQRDRLADIAGAIRRKSAEDPETCKRMMDAIMSICPACGGDEGDHAPGCVLEEKDRRIAELERAIEMPMRAGAPTTSTISSVIGEVISARMKFPGSQDRFLAMCEEHGEVAKAILEGEPFEIVRDEAMQVAATAIRLMEEGDDALLAERFASHLPPANSTNRKTDQ